MVNAGVVGVLERVITYGWEIGGSVATFLSRQSLLGFQTRSARLLTGEQLVSVLDGCGGTCPGL